MPHHRYYSNKRGRPIGILQASEREAIQQQGRCLEELQGLLGEVSGRHDQVDERVRFIKVGVVNNWWLYDNFCLDAHSFINCG